MAFIQFSYSEGTDEGFPHEREVLLTRDTNGDAFLEDVLDFLGDALRAAGYTYVDRVGISTEQGEMKWSKF